MKEKQFNPASTNETSPAPGLAAVNTFNSEELEQNAQGATGGEVASPKNIDRDEVGGPDNNNKKEG